MYKKWEAIRWETPLSDIRGLQMVSLIDDGQLTITLEDLRDEERKRWSVIFEKAPVYQNILEEFRMELWSNLKIVDDNLGWTLKYPNSPWHKKLIKNEDLLELYHPNLEHYQIITEDDVIDVLSENSPVITQIESAGKNDPIPGKSNIYFKGEDDDEIEHGHKDS